MTLAGILIFDDVEVLDFCGPFEVLSVSRRPGEYDDGEKLFEVQLIAQAQRAITTRGGMLVQLHYTIEDHSPLDIVIIPGGKGTRRERLNKLLIDWIQR
jgi:putative intracellular protease/amidase